MEVKGIKDGIRKKDIKGVVSRQKRYATLAKKEGKYALEKAKEEKKKKMPEMTKDSKEEASVAFAFSKMRRKKADKESKKLSRKD